MVTYAVRRLLVAIPVLLVATFIIFWMVSTINDPIAALRQACPNCDQSAYDRLNDLYNLDQPVVQRYFSWLGGVLTGDFGASTAFSDQPAGPIVWERIKNSALLSVPAAVIVIVFSAALSIYSALRQYKLGDYVVTGFTYIGLAMPTFFFGLLLQVFWGIWFQRWTGWKPFWTNGLHDESFTDLISSVTLPILTLVIISLAADTRFGRAAMLETRSADFIRTARAKGVPERTIIFKHLLRAALIPMVTVWALTFGGLLGGTLITETVFSWPGLGRLVVEQGVGRGDVNILMAAMLFIGVTAILFNLLADLFYGWLDPRVRYG